MSIQGILGFSLGVILLIVDLVLFINKFIPADWACLLMMLGLLISILFLIDGPTTIDDLLDKV